MLTLRTPDVSIIRRRIVDVFKFYLFWVTVSLTHRVTVGKPWVYGGLYRGNLVGCNNKTIIWIMRL